MSEQKDQGCNSSLCIRRITRQQVSGDYRFDLQIRTSMGVLTIKGFRWLRGLNRIQAPTCQKVHLISQPADFRAAVRRLFTRLMLEQHGFIVPPLVRRKRNDQSNQRSTGRPDVAARPERIDEEEANQAG